jgi:hypothetical protein
MVLVLLALPAIADRPPPEGSRPLSGILAEVEKRADFAYVEDVEYDDGAYKIEYRTKDGVERKLYIDPKTGQERGK